MEVVIPLDAQQDNRIATVVAGGEAAVLRRESMDLNASYGTFLDMLRERERLNFATFAKGTEVWRVGIPRVALGVEVY